MIQKWSEHKQTVLCIDMFIQCFEFPQPNVPWILCYRNSNSARSDDYQSTKAIYAAYLVFIN